MQARQPPIEAHTLEPEHASQSQLMAFFNVKSAQTVRDILKRLKEERGYPGADPITRRHNLRILRTYCDPESSTEATEKQKMLEASRQ